MGIYTYHFAADIIAEYLKQELICTDPFHPGPWPVYVAQMRDTPDEAIGLSDIGRVTDGRIMKTGETQGQWGFQVRIRSEKYQKARLKTWEIKTKFDEVVRYRLPVEHVVYEIQCINQLMTPTFLGADPNNRVSFTIDCTTAIRQLTETPLEV